MNNFQILELIGQGSYSKVYKVKRIEDGIVYGLKRINFPKLSQQDQQNALNEVRIIASIRSPYIISYKEVFFDDKQNLCIVMEFMDKGDLHQHVIKRNKTKEYFTEQEVWNIFSQLSRALKVIHDLNIIHRDIKSANVFLGSNGEVKLGDFNVSKITDSLWLNTQTGTPYYSSPEIWLQRPYNFKTDIWSLGCVMYDMSALEPPFFAIEPKQVLNNILRDKYTELPDFYSQDLKNLLKKCLTNSILNRPNADDIFNIIQSKFNFPFSNILKEKKQDFEPEIIQTIRISQNIFGADYEGHRTLYFKKMLPKANYKPLNLPPEIQQSFLEHLYMYSTQESEGKSVGLSSSQQQQKSNSTTISDTNKDNSPLKKQLILKKNALVKINSQNIDNNLQHKIKMRVNALHGDDSSGQLNRYDGSVSINESGNNLSGLKQQNSFKASQRNASVSPLQHRRNLKQNQIQQPQGFIQNQYPSQLQQLQQQQHEDNLKYKENHSMSPVRKSNNQISKNVLIKKRQSLVMQNSSNIGNNNNNNSFQQNLGNNNNINNSQNMNISPVQQNRLVQQQQIQQQQQQQQQQQIQKGVYYNNSLSPEKYSQQQKKNKLLQIQNNSNLQQLHNMNLSSGTNDNNKSVNVSQVRQSQQIPQQSSSNRNISPYPKNNNINNNNSSIMGSSQKQLKQKQSLDFQVKQDNLNANYQQQIMNPLNFQKQNQQQSQKLSQANDQIKQNLKDTLFKNQKKQSYLNNNMQNKNNFSIMNGIKPTTNFQKQHQQIQQKIQKQQSYMDNSINQNNNNTSQNIQKVFDPFANNNNMQHQKNNSITEDQKKIMQSKIYKYNNSLSPQKKKSYLQSTSQLGNQKQINNIYNQQQVLKTEGDEVGPIMVHKNSTSISSNELDYSYQKNNSSKVLPNLPYQKRKSTDYKNMNNNINQHIKVQNNKNGMPSSSKDLPQQFYQNQKNKNDTKLTQQLKQMLQQSQA